MPARRTMSWNKPAHGCCAIQLLRIAGVTRPTNKARGANASLSSAPLSSPLIFFFSSVSPSRRNSLHAVCVPETAGRRLQNDGAEIKTVI